MADIRRTIDIHIGTLIDNPRFGIELCAIGNSQEMKGHLQALPNFSQDGTYFFVCLRSHSPNELKAALEEFLNTSLSVAKEMSPDVEGMLGSTSFEIGIHGDIVIAGVNLKENPITAQYAELAEMMTGGTISGEVSLKVGLVFDRTISEILEMDSDNLKTMKGNFHILLQSSKNDKYAIKSKIFEIMGEAKRNQEKIAKLLLLMFSTAEFTITSDDQLDFTEATADHIDKGKKSIEAGMSMAQGMYQQNKEMVDSFPFIQAFFDAVEQYGAGKCSVGVYNKIVTAECDVYGDDLSKIYRQIVG